MIGILIVGHDHFATGMKGAIRLLAGTPEKLLAVDYEQEDSTDDLEHKLKKALNEFHEETDGVLICTDLVNGNPYLLAVELKQKYEEVLPIEVVSGTNLGMLMSVNMGRGYLRDLQALAELAVEEGIKQTVRYKAD